MVTAKDLKTGKTTDTVSTGAPCVRKELQAVGRWIHWSCGPTATAGVWDRTAKKNIPAPVRPGVARRRIPRPARHIGRALLLTARWSEPLHPVTRLMRPKRRGVA
ncbi:hypothetical protein GCM10010269_62340 [Streptomyces humidus]|uniref:Uncharacterized protein n=1 Tax=Streptomyces humidus TaxID=52259 RepID=A0A918G2L2_9ACTN|nr:hypothetical protein GCM10010269_62340 [Streptomyces humidus]